MSLAPREKGFALDACGAKADEPVLPRSYERPRCVAWLPCLPWAIRSASTTSIFHIDGTDQTECSREQQPRRTGKSTSYCCRSISLLLSHIASGQNKVGKQRADSTEILHVIHTVLLSIVDQSREFKTVFVWSFIHLIGLVYSITRPSVAQ